MESDNLSYEQVSSALTSAGIGNHAVRSQNGRLFPLTANSDHDGLTFLSILFLNVSPNIHEPQLTPVCTGFLVYVYEQ